MSPLSVAGASRRDDLRLDAGDLFLDEDDCVRGEESYLTTRPFARFSPRQASRDQPAHVCLRPSAGGDNGEFYGIERGPPKPYIGAAMVTFESYSIIWTVLDLTPPASPAISCFTGNPLLALTHSLTALTTALACPRSVVEV